jgi:hypothetical protein
MPSTAGATANSGARRESRPGAGRRHPSRKLRMTAHLAG